MFSSLTSVWQKLFVIHMLPCPYPNFFSFTARRNDISQDSLRNTAVRRFVFSLFSCFYFARFNISKPQKFYGKWATISKWMSGALASSPLSCLCIACSTLSRFNSTIFLHSSLCGYPPFYAENGSISTCFAVFLLFSCTIHQMPNCINTS